MTLSSLIKRLEDAEGPSRELDIAVMNAVSPFDDTPKMMAGAKRVFVWARDGGLCSGNKYMVEAPYLTASVDAAISLAKRVLPGWRLSMEAEDGIATDLYFLGPDYRDDQPERNSSKPVSGKPIALAMTLATLRAIQSKGEQP